MTTELPPSACGGRVFVGERAIADAPWGEIAARETALVTSRDVFDLHGETLLRALESAAVARPAIVFAPAGEAAKTIESWRAIVDALIESGLTRAGVVFALGGGAICDAAGFAAAACLRGVAVAQIPTTLLAQTDAAIGGKTGVNHPRGKNLIGAFHPPRAVVCDLSTLATLPAREYRSGLAEVVKYGLLGDADFFARIEERADEIKTAAPPSPFLRFAVARAIADKLAIVADDPREEKPNGRALLNLGHTFAHAIEAVAGYGEWLHGEAVAAGIVACAHLSRAVAGFDAAGCARIVSLFARLGLPTRFPDLPSADLLAAMRFDKKNAGGVARFVLLEAVGRARVYENIPAARVAAAIEAAQSPPSA